MNVLYVTNGDGKLGGAKALMEVITEVRKKGINPIVLTPYQNEINSFCEKNNIQNFNCSYKCFMYVKNVSGIRNIIKIFIKYMIYKISNIKAMYEIKSKINFNEIDCIHTNTSIVDFGARLAKKYNKKHIWHLREFGKEDFNFYPLIKNYIKFMNKHTNFFIAISKSVKETWINKGLDINKVKLVYDGIEMDDILQRKSNQNDDLKIVYCGAISNKKGQIHLINALKYMDEEDQKNISIDFIGNYESNYLNHLKEIIKKNNIIVKIRFLGYLSDLRVRLKDYDIAVNCSECEAFGRVTAEYMTAKLCVIAANTGANKEIIDNNGFIYDYKNDKELSDQILYIKNNKRVINEFGDKAYKKVKECFSKEINAKEIIKIYEYTKE